MKNLLLSGFVWTRDVGEVGQKAEGEVGLKTEGEDKAAWVVVEVKVWVVVVLINAWATMETMVVIMIRAQVMEVEKVQVENMCWW